MSGAERQRRYMDRPHIGDAEQRKPPAASFDRPGGRGSREAYLRTRIAELERIVAELRARLAELEATHRGWLKD
jgi:hypothetical protein